MTLLDLQAGALARVAALGGGRAMIERLQAHGLFVGLTVRFLRAAPFQGPLLIEDTASGARLMLARSMAGNVEVVDGDPSPA